MAMSLQLRVFEGDHTAAKGRLGGSLERAAWEKLWADVEALRKRARETK
jgi:hypothetical protein